MKALILFCAVFALKFNVFAQQDDDILLKAYHAESNAMLQTFIKTWKQETTRNVDSNLIKANDTLINLYGILNAFYNPTYSKTKCVLIQPRLQFELVDNLDKDTLLKRTIFSVYKNNADLIYKKALAIPSFYNSLLNDFDDLFSVRLKKGSIEIITSLLTYREKTILPLTEKYHAIINNYLLDNSNEKREERAKRLSFLKGDLNFWEGNYGYIRIENFPANMFITVDAVYKNATISYSGDASRYKATLQKRNGVWVLVESHRTAIE